MTSATVKSVPADRIRAGCNDRKTFDPAGLRQLADSIAASGLAQPPTVRPMPGGWFELVAGERRFRACTELLGWVEVPCHVRELSDSEAADIMLAENEARADLDPIEQARAYRSRLDAGVSIADIVTRCGIPRSRIESRLRLLSLADDIAHLVARGQLTLGQADQIADLDHNRQHLAVAGMDQGLDARGFRQLVVRLTVEQQQDSMFDPDSFFQIEEYVVDARQAASVEQLGLFSSQAEQATRARDAEIRRLRASGQSLRAIAAACGLSHVAVAKICQRAG